MKLLVQSDAAATITTIAITDPMINVISVSIPSTSIAGARALLCKCAGASQIRPPAVISMQAPRMATASFHDADRNSHWRASETTPSKISAGPPVDCAASSKMNSISAAKRRRNAGGCSRSRH